MLSGINDGWRNFEDNFCNFSVNSVSVDGLALSGNRTSVATVMNKFRSVWYETGTGRVNPLTAGNSWGIIWWWSVLWLLMPWRFNAKPSPATILTEFLFDKISVYQTLLWKLTCMETQINLEENWLNASRVNTLEWCNQLIRQITFAIYNILPRHAMGISMKL